MSEEILAELSHVTKTYSESRQREVQAVNDLSLKIYKGETLGIVGESGCGKSTVGNILVHLLKADSGKICFMGQDITGMSEKQFHPLRKNIQMVFQDPYSSMNPRKKIGWLLEEVLLIHQKQLSKKERLDKVREILCDVGLDEEYADRYPGQLSGGQRQRVSIALALMVRPALIVADEPVSALDVSVQAQILNLMKDLQKKYSLTYLFISHDLNVISYLSDRIGVMYLGHLVELGTQKQVGEAPMHPYTKTLFEAAAFSEKAGVGEIPVLVDQPSGCPFHPRCSCCMEKCTVSMPALTEMPDGRTLACFREIKS